MSSTYLPSVPSRLLKFSSQWFIPEGVPHVVVIKNPKMSYPDPQFPVQAIQTLFPSKPFEGLFLKFPTSPPSYSLLYPLHLHILSPQPRCWVKSSQAEKPLWRSDQLASLQWTCIGLRINLRPGIERVYSLYLVDRFRCSPKYYIHTLYPSKALFISDPLFEPINIC